MTVYQTTPARDAEFKDVKRSNQRHRSLMLEEGNKN